MDQTLIDAAKSGDLGNADSFLSSGADVNQADEQQWTALAFAAGQGDLAMVRLLVERGADVFKVTRDKRTPQMIALAAGRVEVVKYLREIEDNLDPEKAMSFRSKRKYSRAYHLKDLQQFPGWPKDAAGSAEEKETADDRIVFMHQDFSVTETIWPDKDLVFDQVTDSWREFCTHVLGFKVLSDFDLMIQARPPANT
jgi:hypothetical protein